MAQESLEEALANSEVRRDKGAPLIPDKAVREAVARESDIRYRRLVFELNRSRDSDIERALRRG